MSERSPHGTLRYLAEGLKQGTALQPPPALFLRQYGAPPDALANRKAGRDRRVLRPARACDRCRRINAPLGISPAPKCSFLRPRNGSADLLFG